MLSAVNPTSAGKGGGVFASTGGSPVGVSDQLLAPPGSTGFPTPSTGPVKEARNNRNSNEKVPYARLVPVRPSEQMKEGGAFAPLPASHGIQTALVDHVITTEYQDLKPGELAWVRGGYIRKLGSAESVARGPSILDFGMGPDRFQRLASTTWVERASVHLFGADVVDLRNLKLVEPDATRKEELRSRQIDEYADKLGDSVVTHVTDVPYILAKEYADTKRNVRPVNSEQVLETGTLSYADEDGEVGAFRCGINTTTTSPFLHGFMMDDSFKKVTIVRKADEAERSLHSVADEPPDFFHEFARNYGDNVAFAALFRELRLRGFFSWSPDGLLLSKLASPADDQMATEELDTRSGQLFNVAVAGNSIATTWTGDPEMPNMPGDGVYMLLVADVETVTGGKDSPEPASATPVAPRDESHTDLAKKFVEAVKLNDGPQIDATRTAATKNFIKNRDLTKEEMKAEYENIAKLSQQVRRNEAGVTSCHMTNFRWRRATSSYLANNSAVKVDSKHCRCNLGLGIKGNTVFGQYIVGAWRIGTVLDNAASRAGAPSMGVRTAPSSYAISVNVHVQWVSGDDLFRKYDGRRCTGISLVGRGEHETAEEVPAHQYADEVVKPAVAAPAAAAAAAAASP